MPRLFDHVLFVVLAAIGPLWAASFGYRRLARATPDALPRMRRTTYRATIALQLGLASAVVALWAATGRPWATLGLVPRVTWGLLGIGLGTAIVVSYIVRQRRLVLGDDAALAEVRERMRHLEPVLPRTPGEMRGFAALAITAGVCEELLYRGFMIQYLAHFTNLIAAAAIAVALFGIGHAYQGWRGIQLTGVVGAFLTAVYLLSGSLLAPMLLHALMDLHSGHLAYVALRRAAEIDAERERESWAAEPGDVDPPTAPARSSAATPDAVTPSTAAAPPAATDPPRSAEEHPA